MENEIGSEDLINKLKQVEQLLEEYENKLHLNKIKIIEPNLDLTSEVMRSMDYEDLQGIVWEYAQYSLAIQKELNKQIRRYNWIETNLKRLLEREAENCNGFKWEERQSNALNDNVFAQKLFRLKTKTKLAIDTLSFLPSKIDFLSKLAIDIMKSKRYKHVENDY